MRKLKITNAITFTVSLLGVLWALGGYLVPTSRDHYSFAAVVNYLADGLPYPAICLFMFFLSSVIVTTFWRLGFKSPYLKVCISIFAIYCLAMLFVMVRLHDTVASNNCFVMLTAIDAGMLSVLFCFNSQRLCSSICFMGTLQAMCLMYNYLSGEHYVSGTVARAIGTTGNPLQVSATFLTCIPLSVSLALTHRGVVRTLYQSALILMLASLLLTWNRGDMTSLTWMLNRALSNKKLIVGSAAILFAFALLEFLVRSHGIVNQGSSHRSIFGRTLIWQQAWHVFTDHWLFGVGFCQVRFPVVHQVPGGRIVEELFDSPANVYLSILDQAGLCGGILALIFAVSLKKAIRCNLGGLNLAVCCIWTSFLIAGLWDNVFGVWLAATGNALVGALFGITLLLRRENLSKDDADPKGLSLSRKEAVGTLLCLS